jgi:hypothetical protein
MASHTTEGFTEVDGGGVRCLNSDPTWRRIRELHAQRFGTDMD